MTAAGRLTNLRLNRRALLRGVVVGAAGGAMAPLLAACGGSTATATTGTSGSGATGSTATTSGTSTTSGAGASASPTTTASGPAPTPGGTLTLGILSEPPTMDPRVSGSAEASDLMINLFDSLVALDRQTGELKPGLATAWQATPDGKTYTFTLRTGVKFHDGTPFNADAVKYTYDSIVDPTLKSLSAIGALGPYDSTEVVDEQTVKVNFKSAYAPFLNNVTSTILAPVSPTAAKTAGPANFGIKPVGTGPFMFKEWQQKISMTFVKNPDYAWPVGTYQHTGAAYLDQIVIKFIPEATTLNGALTSGQINITDGVQPQQVKTLRANSSFQVLLPSVPGVPQILPINATKSPTDDLQVRQAILYAIDRKTLVNTLWFGTVKVAYGPLSSSTWSYDSKVETMYPYDPQKAAQLLDAAGWTKGSSGVREKNGQQLELAYITDNSSIDSQAGQLVQSYLTDAGMKVNLQVLEYAATAADYLAGKHNIARIGYTGVDPYVLTTTFSSRNITGTNFNRTMKPDATLDKMLDDATAEMDRTKRQQDYIAIQEYIMNQALMIPLWEQTVLWGAGSSIKGLYPQSLGQIGFYDTWIAK